MAFNNTVVARAAASIWGLKLGNGTVQWVLAELGANGGNLNAIINSAFENSFATASNQAVATAFVDNLGLTGQARTDGLAAVLAELAAAPAGGRGAVLSGIAGLFSNLVGDPTYGTFAVNFNTQVAAAAAYSSMPGTVDSPIGSLSSGTSFMLTRNQDNITGTAGNDTFNAFIFDNGNTLQSGDFVDGGAGTDTLYADLGSSAAFAITPVVRNVENISIRGQSSMTDPAGPGGNNLIGGTRVIVDFERVNGVTRIESNNSRADVIVEDVRILPSQITKDITIAFVQSDPGNVDFGVYFDQASLRASSSSSSVLTLQVIDTKAAGEGNPPLLNNPYDGVSFSLNGQLVLLQDAAIGNATTYAQLLSAIQGRLAANPLTNGVVTAALGSTFSVIDPVSQTTVTGTSIVLSAAGAVFGIGNWIASQGVPAESNVYTNQIAGATTTNDLVTSTIILDDVGRGSNGGDLVVGGLSTGATSGSRGVDRFEITVERTSRLQNIDSTNNWLKEVTVKNGSVNGNLSVLGNVAGGGNDALPGAVQNFDSWGFNDVRLIDGTAMAGSFNFRAAVTAASFSKYIVTTDTGPLPGGDNGSVPGTTTQFADFIYSGGANNDSITVQINGAMAGSNSNVLVGREDFTFRVNGNGGNDSITVRIVDSDEQGGTSAIGGQNWYAHQKALRNITVDGGTGNDTIRTPGAGDVIILAGDGDDVIYTDNMGAQDAGPVTSGPGGSSNAAYSNFNPWNSTAIVPNGQNAIWVFNTDNSGTVAQSDTAREISDLRSDANNSYNLYKGTVTVNFKGLTKTLTLPTASATGGLLTSVSDAVFNQRIKAAINDDPILNKLLVAQDGPGFTLIVKSLIDGDMVATDLSVTIAAAQAASFSASELAQVAAAYNLPVGATAADVQAVFSAALVTLNTNADYGAATLSVGTSVSFNALAGRNLGNDIVGANSTFVSDNTVTPGAGNDVIVLGTTIQADAAASSNETVVYGANFGNDVIVNFDFGGAGIDQLNFSAIGGRSNAGFVNDVTNAALAPVVTTNRAIVIDNLITAAAGNDTLAKVIAAYFTDTGSATAANTYVVVVVDTATNIGSVYSITDPVGGTAGAVGGSAGANITGVLAGTIDLADTLWQNLTAANFTTA